MVNCSIAWSEKFDANNVKVKLWEMKKDADAKVALWCSGYHYCTTSFN